MLSFQRLFTTAAVGASLLLAACGGNSQNPASSAPSGSSPASGGHASGGAASGGHASAPSSALTLTTAKGSLGAYLVGADGRAMYLWVADTNGRSSCAGACAAAWPPVTTSTMPHATGGVNAADLTLISRSGGTKQVAYKGHPLYYYTADTGPGMTTGEGSDSFGAKWWLVAPSGSGITARGSSAGASSSGSAGSSSGGSSGSSSSGGSSGSSSGSSWS